MKLQLLVSAVKEEVTTLAERMNVRTDAWIVNQCDRFGYQNARSGGGVRPGFEGGQLPIYRKLPKRGFHNHFAKHYAIVNLSTLNEFETGEVVDMNALLQAGYIRKELDGLKILGGGELAKKLTVKANVFSASAKEKIEALGGSCEVI